MRRILIVGHNPHFALSSNGAPYEFVVVSAQEAEGLLDSEWDGLVVDVTRQTGIDLIRRIRLHPHARDVRVLATAEWGTGYGSLALSLGADAYEPMLCDSKDILAAVRRLLRPRLAVAK